MLLVLRKSLCGQHLGGLKTLPEPSSCVIGCSQTDSSKASPSLGSSLSCCRPAAQKNGLETHSGKFNRRDWPRLHHVPLVRSAGAQLGSYFPLGQREAWWEHSLPLSWPLDLRFSLWARSKPSNAFLWRVFTSCVFCINPLLPPCPGPEDERWGMPHNFSLQDLILQLPHGEISFSPQVQGQAFAHCCEHIKDLAAKF